MIRAASWLGSFTVLIVFQLAGTALVTLSGLPLPGPVVGLVLLTCWLTIGHRGREWRRRQVEPAAEPLLGALPLLFVPAGVGVVRYLPLLNQYALAVVAALVISTVVTLLAAGGLLEILLRRRGRRE